MDTGVYQYEALCSLRLDRTSDTTAILATFIQHAGQVQHPHGSGGESVPHGGEHHIVVNDYIKMGRWQNVLIKAPSDPQHRR